MGARRTVRMRQPSFRLGRFVFCCRPRVIGRFRMGMVPQVLGFDACLVHAICRNRTPAELEREHCSEHEYEATSHRSSISPQVARQKHRLQRNYRE